MESDGYGSPWSTEAGKKGGKKLHGKYYNQLTADIHYQKGMECIDCHTALDLHGDGNIYSKKWQAVEIECEDCHASQKAIGLGTGTYISKANGVDIDFELERIVDEDGKQIQATNHDGTRPFNKEELQRILKVNTCMACHQDTTDAEIWKKVTDVTGFAKTDAKHRELIKKLFDRATKK